MSSIILLTLLDISSTSCKESTFHEFDILINIQEKLKQGKGKGYENWSKRR
ncbi:hypothetical protein [Butyrivibrio sp. WCD2001]|uniref:hypothetical protein n=1 Tax=Butyrivibrio sp. WCD2001 TaxID=1280681 RepID=UPI0004189F98|nr:hypothetical protein [Butyrivibrio sp. WCD2001]